MGIPIKNSRQLVHQDQKYRYLVKETTSTQIRPGDIALRITVQIDSENPGQVLQVETYYKDAITPKIVCLLIDHGLEKGWKPNESGGAMMVDMEKVWNKL